MSVRICSPPSTEKLVVALTEPPGRCCPPNAGREQRAKSIGIRTRELGQGQRVVLLVRHYSTGGGGVRRDEHGTAGHLDAFRNITDFELNVGPRHIADVHGDVGRDGLLKSGASTGQLVRAGRQA
jgi:hypothetical protein